MTPTVEPVETLDVFSLDDLGSGAKCSKTDCENDAEYLPRAVHSCPKKVGTPWCGSCTVKFITHLSVPGNVRCGTCDTIKPAWPDLWRIDPI